MLSPPQAKYVELSNSSAARIRELGAAADTAAADAEAARRLADSRMPPEQVWVGGTKYCYCG